MISAIVIGTIRIIHEKLVAYFSIMYKSYNSEPQLIALPFIPYPKPKIKLVRMGIANKAANHIFNNVSGLVIALFLEEIIP